MFWSLSLQLIPGEAILEDSTGTGTDDVKPAYSVFLTNKRAVFRFDGLGSTMAQSFLYDEITEARPVRRMFITYLNVQARGKDYFLHTPEPEHWAARLLEAKRTVLDEPAVSSPAGAPAAGRKRDDLHRMLDHLRRHAILTDAEYAEKVRLLDRITG